MGDSKKKLKKKHVYLRLRLADLDKSMGKTSYVGVASFATPTKLKKEDGAEEPEEKRRKKKKGGWPGVRKNHVD